MYVDISIEIDKDTDMDIGVVLLRSMFCNALGDQKGRGQFRSTGGFRA